MWYGERETTVRGEGHKKNKTATLRTVVRKRKEQEQGDITHSEMAVMTEAKREKLSIRISVIPLMRCRSVVLVFQPPRCGHLCHRRSLWTSSPKVCSNIHSVASAVNGKGTGVEIRHSIQRGPVHCYLGNQLWPVELLCSALPTWKFPLWQERKRMRWRLRGLVLWNTLCSLLRPDYSLHLLDCLGSKICMFQ